MNARSATSLAVCQEKSTELNASELKKELAGFARLPNLTHFQASFIDRLQAKDCSRLTEREWTVVGMLRFQLESKRQKYMRRQKISSPRGNATRKGLGVQMPKSSRSINSRSLNTINKQQSPGA